MRSPSLRRVAVSRGEEADLIAPHRALRLLHKREDRAQAVPAALYELDLDLYVGFPPFAPSSNRLTHARSVQGA